MLGGIKSLAVVALLLAFPSTEVFGRPITCPASPPSLARMMAMLLKDVVEERLYLAVLVGFGIIAFLAAIKKYYASAVVLLSIFALLLAVRFEPSLVSKTLESLGVIRDTEDIVSNLN